MKKIVITIIFLAACSVHAQTDEKETLKQISQNVVSSYKDQKFDEALKLAQQALDLSVKIYGTESRETAVAYTNLGAIYQQKNKLKIQLKISKGRLKFIKRIPTRMIKI